MLMAQLLSYDQQCSSASVYYFLSPVIRAWVYRKLLLLDDHEHILITKEPGKWKMRRNPDLLMKMTPMFHFINLVPFFSALDRLFHRFMVDYERHLLHCRLHHQRTVDDLRLRDNKSLLKFWGFRHYLCKWTWQITVARKYMNNDKVPRMKNCQHMNIRTHMKTTPVLDLQNASLNTTLNSNLENHFANQ